MHPTTQVLKVLKNELENTSLGDKQTASNRMRMGYVRIIVQSAKTSPQETVRNCSDYTDAGS